MRVRIFELRLVALGLTALWGLCAAYVVLGYHPGGPIDHLVGASTVLPVAISLAAVRWPPVARGGRVFAGIVWLGICAGLVLVPSIGGVLNQLTGGDPQTLLPSPEAAYPWLLALLATCLFTGLGIARRLLGETSLLRFRLTGGLLVGTCLALVAGSLVATTAIANDMALQQRPASTSRFGPTNGVAPPPLCDGSIETGPTAALELDLIADVDGRQVGMATLTGARAQADVRWTADVASQLFLGRFGAARVGGRAWTAVPRQGWMVRSVASVQADLVDSQILATALAPEDRTTAEDRGIDFVEGARARRCRVAVDGPTFLTAVPQADWFAGSDTLARWRGQLDFWIFADGQLGQVSGTVNGPASGIGGGGIQGTIHLVMTATDRRTARFIVPPVAAGS